MKEKYMENNNQFYDESFIARWIAGETTINEQTELQEWLQNNPKGKRYFENLVFIWEKTNQIKIKSNLTDGERWSSITEKINGQQTYKPKRTGTSLFWRVTSVAAIIIIMVAVYYWNLNNKIISEVSSRGEHKTVLLPGDSEITLNAESTLKYSKNNWQQKREVILEGEAFFKVTSGKEFYVKSNFITTKVLGTSFNIKSRDNKVEIACVSGKVQVESIQQIFSPIILTPELKSIFIKGDPLQTTTRFNIKDRTSWLDGNYIFKSVPLVEVFEEIERQFDCKITLAKQIGKTTYSGSLDRKNLEKSIEMVCLSAGLKYSSVGTSEYKIH